MSFSVMGIVGALALGGVGAAAGVAAGLNVATNIGLADLKIVGIVVLGGGVIGAIGGISVGLATLGSLSSGGGIEITDNRDTTKLCERRRHLVAGLRVAQIAWVLITLGISLPYLAFVVFSSLHLSQIAAVGLDMGVLTRVAGLVGAIFWVDGVVMQFIAAFPNLRSLVSAALSLS